MKPNDRESSRMFKDENKTKTQVIHELKKLRRRIAVLENSEVKLKQIGEELRDREFYFKAILASIKAGVMVIDVEKHEIVDVNKAASELIGASKKNIIGKECHQYVCPAERGRCPITDLNQVIDNSERFLINARHRKVPIIKTVVPITIKNRKYLLETFIDITEQKRMDEKLKRLATTDILTGAYNRTVFDEIISREMERVKRYNTSLSVIMFDIDHFKRVNDTFGHNVGDSVLKKIARIVKRTIRKVDYFIRWGGEEFLIISAETNLEQAYVLAERLRSGIETSKFNNISQITVSCGVARYEKEDTRNTLIKRVDDAMYKAKRTGRNRVVMSI
jgi:diguanylate cyclase (GGDEF)-like protein/PAS domain S-box-containing protein